MSPKAITITEEGPAVYIEIKLTLPPKYKWDGPMLDGQIYTLIISLLVEISNSDPTCYLDQQKIPQAIIGRIVNANTNSSSEIYITRANWYVKIEMYVLHIYRVRYLY